METYRVYIYYLRTAKHKDFDSKNDALNYAYDIANNNEKAMPAPEVTRAERQQR